MARVKNNNEYRTKIGNIIRNSLESNPNNKKMLDYSNTLEQVKVDYKNYFDNIIFCRKNGSQKKYKKRKYKSERVF